MRILILSDIESSSLWDYFGPSKLEEIDLIISCGDLDPHYLSFLATFSQVPVLYVHGNHDDRYQATPPEGCICIEDTIFCHQGLRILGLGALYVTGAVSTSIPKRKCAGESENYFPGFCSTAASIFLSPMPPPTE